MVGGGGRAASCCTPCSRLYRRAGCTGRVFSVNAARRVKTPSPPAPAAAGTRLSASFSAPSLQDPPVLYIMGLIPLLHIYYIYKPTKSFLYFSRHGTYSTVALLPLITLMPSASIYIYIWQLSFLPDVDVYYRGLFFYFAVPNCFLIDLRSASPFPHLPYYKTDNYM